MSRPFRRLRQFFAELKRRNVYKVAVGYLVAAFVALQAADLLVPETTLPAGTETVIVYLTIAGFPIALVIAWAFEMTPEGVRRTPEAEPEGPEGAEAGTRTAYKVLVGIGLVAAAVAGGWYLTGGGGGSPTTQEETVAVLPFEISGTGANEWRDGMVSLLSTGLDGAGALRAIPDRTVFAAWEERAQPNEGASAEEALAVARQIGAEYAVVGSAVALGEELRLTANVRTTSSGERLGQVEVRGSPDSVPTLADSLTREVLAILIEESGDLPSVELGDLTTFSLPALKAYLAAERHYRNGEYELAVEDYEAAAEQDSGFALAHFGAFEAKTSMGILPQAHPHLRRAHQLSDDLPLRARRKVWYAHTSVVEDRPLTAGDSLRHWKKLYPDDPRIWYEWGGTLLRGWYPGGWRMGEEAIQRALRLNSKAKYHDYIIWSAFTYRHDSAAASRRVEAYPEQPRKEYYRLLSDLIFGIPEQQQRVLARLDTLTIPNLPLIFWDGGAGALTHPEALDLQERLIRVLIEREALADPDRAWLADNLLKRGRIEEARPLFQETPGAITSLIFPVGAGLAAAAPDTLIRRYFDLSRIEAGASFERLVGAGVYLLERERPGELGTVLERIRRWSARVEEDSARAGRYASWGINLLKAYRAHLAGNPRQARKLLSRVEGLPPLGRLLRGDVYRDLGELERAAGWYLTKWWHPVAHERLGQLYEEMGKPEKAAAAYRRFIEAWKNADEELQPRVEAARERLRELTASEAEPDE